MEEETKFENGQELKFDIYGTIIVGKFLFEADHIIHLEVIDDSSGITNQGDLTTIHETFII